MGGQGRLVGTQGPDVQGCCWVQGKGPFRVGRRIPGWIVSMFLGNEHVFGMLSPPD